MSDIVCFSLYEQILRSIGKTPSEPINPLIQIVALLVRNVIIAKYGNTFCDFTYFDQDFDNLSVLNINNCDCCKNENVETYECKTNHDNKFVCVMCVEKIKGLPNLIEQLWDETSQKTFGNENDEAHENQTNHTTI